MSLKPRNLSFATINLVVLFKHASSFTEFSSFSPIAVVLREVEAKCRKSVVRLFLTYLCKLSRECRVRTFVKIAKQQGIEGNDAFSRLKADAHVWRFFFTSFGSLVSLGQPAGAVRRDRSKHGAHME